MARMQMNKDEVCVYMFEEDYKKITRWVLRFPDLETGGSLFGLWKNHDNPIANFVLGPGKGCKRTNVSFYQDISYLEKVGNVLTHDYMLCHIGEWHSHHRLHLYEPSSGDVGTVVRNYPRGACGFVLIIANIVSPEHVSLSPYLFTEETCTRMAGPKYKAGQIHFISGASPFQNVSPLCNDVFAGEETYPSPPTVAQTFDKIKITEKRSENIGSVGDYGKSKEKQQLNKKYPPAAADERSSYNDLKSGVDGGHNVKFNTSDVLHHNPEKNAGVHVVPRPSKQEAIFQLGNYGLNERSNPPCAAGTHVQQMVKYSASEVRSYAPTTVVTACYSQTNLGEIPSHSKPQESVLQKAGLDPPGRVNPTTATTIGLSESIKTEIGAAGFTSNSTNLQGSKYSNEGTRNWNERGGRLQPCDSDPLRATEVSAASTTDSIFVLPHQWYSTPKGEEDLMLLTKLLAEVADAGDIEMNRNQNTHDLEMKFSHHGTKWIIEFSPFFPGGGTKLKQEQYNIQRKVYYNKTVKVITSTTLQAIAKEVIGKVRLYCTKCPTGGTINFWSRH